MWSGIGAVPRMGSAARSRERRRDGMIYNILIAALWLTIGVFNLVILYHQEKILMGLLNVVMVFLSLGLACVRINRAFYMSTKKGA